MYLLGNYFCEISAWCPVENDEKLSRTTPVLNNTEKFTVYIKNSVAFPYFGMEYRKNNIQGIINTQSQSDHCVRMRKTEKHPHKYVMMHHANFI